MTVGSWVVGTVGKMAVMMAVMKAVMKVHKLAVGKVGMSAAETAGC